MKKTKNRYCNDCPYKDKVEVPYSGDKNAKVVFVGESPGEDEIKQRKPFVGKSGMLLRNILSYFDIDNFFIANSCRCMINKDNESLKDINKALSCCRNYLKIAISKIKPKLIVCLGAIALKQVLGFKQTMQKSRGRFFKSDEFGCDVFVTYHPSYLLRNGVSVEFPNVPNLSMSMIENIILEDFKMISDYVNEDIKPDKIDIQNYIEVKEFKFDTKPKVISFDFETNGVSYFADDFKLLSVAVAIEEGKAQTIITDTIPDSLREILEDPTVAKVVASRPFEEMVYKRLTGSHIKGTIHDVLVMAHLIDENYKTYSLEEVANAFTNLNNIKDLSEGMRTNLQNASRETLVAYNCVDADATLRAFNTLIRKIASDSDLARYYKYFIIPAMNVLSQMHEAGFKIDLDVLQQSIDEANRLLKEFKDKCLSLVHPEIIKKHKDKLSLTRAELIRDVLFTHPKGYKLKPDKQYLTAKTKVPQVSEKHLRQLPKNEFIDAYFNWCKLHKVKNTYLDTLKEFVYPDGRVHPQIFLNRTVTGRTAIIKPALHQIPQRHPFAYLVKRCFVADEGWLLGARDLSQSEFRIMGWIAGDKNILEAVNSGVDLHSKTASVVNNVPIDKVTKEMRQKAKSISFGFLYGMSAEGFQRYAKEKYEVDFTLDECRKFREMFFSRPNGYYALPAFYANVENIVLNNGYIKSPLGRIRRFPELKNMKKSEYSKVMRQAVNFPISSFSTDLGLIGSFLFMQEVEKNTRLKGNVKCILFIHDSLMITAKEEIMSEALELLGQCMCIKSKEYIREKFGIKVGYKIESDKKVGKSWASLEEVKD